jgi:uncharacterized protein YndB with AHSA1/START domain
MRSDDGKIEVWSTGQYLEIIPNQKIVVADHRSNADGEILPPEKNKNEGPFSDKGESFITVEFDAVNDDKVQITVSHEGLPARMHDECVDGWNSSLKKLQMLVEKH